MTEEAETTTSLQDKAVLVKNITKTFKQKLNDTMSNVKIQKVDKLNKKPVKTQENQVNNEILLKDSLAYEKNHKNTHPGMFVLCFVILIMGITLAMTLHHFTKTRRERRELYLQQQDIEVRSISSLGNELW